MRHIGGSITLGSVSDLFATFGAFFGLSSANMQAVILAAGEGKRLRPLTLDRPKPMVELLGKPILEHTIAELPSLIDELIIVVGYKGEKIKEHFSSAWKGRPITYVEQALPPTGTATALFSARAFLRPGQRFASLMGDNVSGGSALEKALEHDFALLVRTHEHPEHFGVIELHEDGTIKNMHEHPKNPPTNLVSTGTYVLSEDIFSVAPVLNPDRNEYLLPDLLLEIAKRQPVAVVEQDFWVSVDKPDDIPGAEALLRARGH